MTCLQNRQARIICGFPVLHNDALAAGAATAAVSPIAALHLHTANHAVAARTAAAVAACATHVARRLLAVESPDLSDQVVERLIDVDALLS